MKTFLHTYLTTRGRLVALAAGLGVALRLGQSFPEEPSLPGVLTLLSQATESEVSEGAWEPSRGVAADLVWGRPFLFLARSAPDAPRDVFRAFIRVSPDGAPLSVTRTRNLTHTLIADEQGLLVQGHHAAFATVAYDEVQGVTLLDVRKAPRTPAPTFWLRPVAALERAIDDFRSTGSMQGLTRTDLEPSPRPPGLTLELAGAALTLRGQDTTFVVSGLDEEGPLRITSTHALAEGTAGASLTAHVRVPSPRPFAHWLEGTDEGLPSARAATWLEARIASVRDFVRRSGDRIRSSNDALRSGAATSTAPSVTGAAPAVWPPPSITPLWKDSHPNEGRWQPVPHPFAQVKRGESNEPALFYRTSLYPDPKRLYAEVVLVAMDTRRLELGMVAGSETPRPSAGLPGSGHVPTAADVHRRIIATFNGGQHDEELGMVVDGRVLLPPTPGAATVHIDRSGRVGLGTWPAPAAPGDAQEPAVPTSRNWSPKELPSGVVSLRQSGEPLLSNGVPTASKQSTKAAAVTERTALCVTRTGQLVYAWTPSSTRDALADALRSAACDYALPLALGGSRGAFELVDLAKLSASDARAEALDPRMHHVSVLPSEPSHADFFYLALRPSVPRAVGFAWQADPGAQPTPAGMPAIFSAREELGALTIELTRFDRGRFTWLVGPSNAESTSTVVDTELAPDQAATVLATIGLGHTTDRTRYGLQAKGRLLVPLQRALATLILPANAEPYVAPSGIPVVVPDGADAVQLPVLAEDGQLTARARELGGLRRRGALCLDDQGNLLVARMQHDSAAPAARALLALGCQLVMELDRGSHSAPFVERTGASTGAPVGPGTVLYALGREPSPRAYSGAPR